MKNVFRINADIKGSKMATSPFITQNDAVSFEVSLYDGDKEIDLSSVTMSTLASTRGDKVTVVVTGEKTGVNKVTFDIGTSETKLTGDVNAVVQLYSADGRVSTVRFIYKVTSDPTGEGFIPSEHEKTLIEVILGDGPLVIEQAIQATADAEAATVYIDGKKPLIDKFTGEQSNLQSQLDQVAIGATNAETSQARVDAKGTSHATLKTRLDTEMNSVTSSLADTAKYDFQSSFVDTVKGLLYFKEMYFKKISNTELEVMLITGNDRHITHNFKAKDDGYLISFNCFDGSWEKIPSKIMKHWTDTVDGNTGSWIVGEDQHTVYTTTPNASFTLDFDSSPNGSLVFWHWSEDRGGIMEFTLDGDKVVEFSTYSPTAGYQQKTLFTNLSEGSHTIKARFVGDDPEHAPRGGTSRGWLRSPRDNMFDIDSYSFNNTKENEIFAIGSNREFAFRFGQEGTTETEWLPYHGTNTANIKKPPRVRLDGATKNLNDIEIGKLIPANDFSLIQNIYGAPSANKTLNILEVYTTQTINRIQGSLLITGSMELLENANMGSSYVIMGAVRNDLFDRLLTGIGNEIPATKADNTLTMMYEEANKTKEYAFVSTENDYVVAYKNFDMRRNLALMSPQYTNVSNYLQHRNDVILKHYVNIFANIPIPKGFKYSWAGEYAVGEIEGIRKMLEQN